MTASRRKVVHAVGVAVISSLTDLSVQLSNPSINWSRTLIAGVVTGLLARLFGAWLSATTADEPDAQP